MNYKSEEEFLKNYDSSIFDKPSVTTDILVFSVSNEDKNNYRKLDKKQLSVLLVKRNDYPFKDMWNLPGGFIGMDETSEEASRRILKNETNLDNIYLEQLYTFDQIDRDPRMRIFSIAQMALVDKNLLDESINENASWFNVEYSENSEYFDIKLDNGDTVIKYRVKKVLKEHTSDRYHFVIDGDTNLAFDHARVIVVGLARLKNKIEYTDIVFNMMPKYFTLGNLQQVYEVILNKKLFDQQFRRMVSNKVVKTDKIENNGGHRPSVLYTYKG